MELLVLTRLAVVILIGDCFVPSHFLLNTPHLFGPKPKHFVVVTLNELENRHLSKHLFQF